MEGSNSSLWLPSTSEPLWALTMRLHIYPPTPACQGPPGCEESCNQSLDHWYLILTFSPIFHHQLINPRQLPLIHQQLINQLLINLLFASLQVSNLVIGTRRPKSLDHHVTLNLAWSLSLGSLVKPWNSFKFQRISNSPQIIKLVPQDSRKCQKWGPNTYLKSSKSWKCKKSEM